MIRILFLFLLTFAVVPASLAAEPRTASLVLTQAQATPPAAPQPPAQIQIQMQAQRNSVYETLAIVAIAGGAGALLAAMGTTALTTTLVAGGAAGIVYLATSANSEPR